MMQLTDGIRNALRWKFYTDLGGHLWHYINPIDVNDVELLEYAMEQIAKGSAATSLVIDVFDSYLERGIGPAQWNRMKSILFNRYPSIAHEYLLFFTNEEVSSLIQNTQESFYFRKRV